MSDKQVQKAGDNAQQVQAEMVHVTNNYVLGIGEKRVREVCSEMAVEAIKSCTAEATATAMSRIESFTTTLIPRIEKIEKDFYSFSEPSFQFLLQSAQKTAACTDREADYELLSELLVHRIEKGSERKTKASISKAIEIVDQVDDDALCGLTMAYAINQWIPVTGNISKGLQVLNDLFGSLCYRILPNGFDWVYDLDVLDAVRASSVGNFKKMEEFYPNAFEGYTCVGIQKESKNYQSAIELLNEGGLPIDLLVEHELLNGYVRLSVSDQASIKEMRLPILIQNNVLTTRKMNEKEINILNKIWNLYSNDATKKNSVKQVFMQKWDEYESLHKVHLWWNDLPHSFTITPIGKVLAHANAQRYNKRIPNINQF